MKQNRFLGLTLPALLATLLWGTAFPAVKSGYALFAIGSSDTAGQMLFAGARFAAAGVLTFAVEAAVSRRLVLPERKRLPGLLLLTLVMTYLQYLFYYIGLANTSGVKGAILNASGTFFTMILAHFVCAGDRLNGRKAAGCLVGFAGVVIIHMGGEMGGFALRGEGFMLIAAACFAVGSIISKWVAQGLSPMVVTGFQLLLGVLELNGEKEIGGDQIVPFALLGTIYCNPMGLATTAFFIETYLKPFDCTYSPMASDLWYDVIQFLACYGQIESAAKMHGIF